MPIDLTNMRLGVTRPIGVNVGGTQIPTEQIDSYLNRAFWEVQNKFPFKEKEIVSSFDTIAGARNYDVSFPTEAVKHVSIRKSDLDGETKHYPLVQITRDVYEQNYDSSSDYWDFPTSYVREGCIIRLYPTPDDAYHVIISRLIALTDLSNLKTTTGIPQVWDEIIVLGALWRICIDLGDLNRSSWFKSMQAEMINTIVPTEVNEAQSNSQLARVEVLGLDY